MSLINVKFLSGDEIIKYELKTNSDIPFCQLAEKLYEKYPYYQETVNYFMYKGSGIYDYSKKKLSELNIINNSVLILVQTDQIRKNEIAWKKMLERQKKLRKNSKEELDDLLTEEQKKNKKINDILEDMCIYGNIMKKEIEYEKKNHPDKYIEADEALRMEKEDQGFFALGLLSKLLENIGIETAIEKDVNKDDKLSDETITCLQFLSNGMINKMKYNLHFDFGKEKNEELLKDESKFENFKEKLKLKLSKDYKISTDEIIVTYPQKGSFSVDLIFRSEEFNNLNEQEFLNNFKNEKEFKELKNLKEIHSDVIMGGCKLSKNQLDYRGNRTDGWGTNENRGGLPYDPPKDWIGIGLKVLDKYENNTWIGMENIEGEWCVAYHGVADGKKSNKVKKAVGLIYKGSFKKGEGQVHSKCMDQYHPGKIVGEGVYCTPLIKTAEEYAGCSKINGINYKTVLMVRVNPKAIRHCASCEESRNYKYWVVNGTTDEIRPYRILYKAMH